MKKRFQITWWGDCLGMQNRLEDMLVYETKTKTLEIARQEKKSLQAAYKGLYTVWYQIEEVK